MKLKPHTVNWHIYKNRVDAWIDVTLDSMLWLAKNNPDVFLNPENCGNDRLKKLLLTIKALMRDNIDVELVRSLENDKTEKVQ